MSCFDEGVLAGVDNNNKDGFMDIFYIHTPWNCFLRKPSVGNNLSAVVICRNLACVRLIITSIITITIKSDDLTL